MSRLDSIVIGILFVILGVIFGLNALDITNIDLFFDGWWSLFFIVPGFVGIIKNKNVGFNLGLVSVGTLLLCMAQGLVSFELIRKLIIPIIFVIIGICILFKDAFVSKFNNSVKNIDKSKLQDFSATFSEQHFNVQGNFQGANIDSVFGSVILDLKNANISEDVLVNASSIFGSTTIYTNENYSVQVKKTAIFGGVNNTKAKFDENKKTIYVNSFCLFGEVTIR